MEKIDKYEKDTVINKYKMTTIFAVMDASSLLRKQIKAAKEVATYFLKEGYEEEAKKIIEDVNKELENIKETAEK